MDPAAFLETVEAEHETELSRLASSKVLYALTAGEMDDAAVFAATVARTTAAATVFDAWAGDEPDETAADTFDAACEAMQDDAAAIDAAADDAGVALEPARESIAPPGPLFDRLADLEATLDRAAGLAAWTLVEDGVRGQAVGFFVGRADPSSADAFRALRSTVETVQDDALGLLADVAGDDGDWDRATETASAVIDAAYDHYVEALERQGIKVKPVC